MFFSVLGKLPSDKEFLPLRWPVALRESKFDDYCHDGDDSGLT